MVRSLQERYVIAFNPNSGKGLGRGRADTLRQALQAAGAEVVLRETRRDKNVFAEPGLDEDAAAVVVLGGDGTLHEACNGLADHRSPLLFCGMGTVNVFGLEFGLDPSPEGCVALLETGRQVRMPLLRATESRRFVMFAEVGFLGRAVARVNERRRRTGRHGKIEFVGAFLAECFSSWGRPVRVIDGADDRERGRYSNVLITRSRHYADHGKIPIDARVTTPLLEESFEVVGYRTRTPLGHLIATAVVAGGLLPRLLPLVRGLGLLDVFSSRHLRLHWDRSEACHVDAETLVTDQLDIRASGAIEIIVPKDAVVGRESSLRPK